jgi:hypothetical protein
MIAETPFAFSPANASASQASAECPTIAAPVLPDKGLTAQIVQRRGGGVPGAG